MLILTAFTYGAAALFVVCLVLYVLAGRRRRNLRDVCLGGMAGAVALLLMLLLPQWFMAAGFSLYDIWN